MSISSVGKKFLAVHVVVLLLDIFAVAFSARVNIFQEFYFMADLFPLGLSITTLIVLFLALVADLAISNAPTARPAVQIGLLYILSIFWLAFNAFSTSRWRNVPINCSSIPEEFADTRTWCRDVQALKSFVWLEFVALFLTATFTLQYTLKQHRRGHTMIWHSPLSRFNPNQQMGDSGDMFHRATYTDHFGRGNSEFVKF